MPYHHYCLTVSGEFAPEALANWSHHLNQEWCAFWAREFFTDQQRPYFQLKVLEQQELAIYFELLTSVTPSQMVTRIKEKYPQLVSTYKKGHL